MTIITNVKVLLSRTKKAFDFEKTTIFALQIKEEVWEQNSIQDKSNFEAILGPTGGSKGYEAITGEPSSDKNVVWWINGLLMPEIYVVRGRTYFFRVQVISILQSKFSEYNKTL